MPRLEIPGGATGLLPPRYTTAPGLRKGNASRCNIKRASLNGAPSQPLRGGKRRWECIVPWLDGLSVFMVFRSHVSNLIINKHKFRLYFLLNFKQFSKLITV